MNGFVLKAASVIVIAGAWAAMTRPSNSSHETRAGNAAYQRGEAAEARRHFDEALKWDSEDPQLRLNAATAALEARQFDRGMQLNSIVAQQSETLADDAAYNSGTAFLRQQKAVEAIELLRESLRRNPQNLDAKRNLELAERLRQQRNQSGGDSGEQEDGGDDEGGENGAAEGGEQPDPQSSADRGEVTPEEILRAVAQQEAEELRRMRAARAEGQKRGRGW